MLLPEFTRLYKFFFFFIIEKDMHDQKTKREERDWKEWLKGFENINSKN